MPARKKNFYDVVARPTVVRSQSGYASDVDSGIWELRGRRIDYGLLADAVTKPFLQEIKHRFADVINTQLYADSSIQTFFSALKDCIHFSFRGTGQRVNALTDAILEEWSAEPTAHKYPYHLKLFINACRARDPQTFPEVTEKVLKRLKKPDVEVEHVLSLDPRHGPWLEREVLDQDKAIEAAYTSGAWHVERYVFVQLFRLYGMRPDQVANMKIGDVRCRATEVQQLEA